MIRDMMQTDVGAIIISVILGLGLAALFRRVCTGSGCIVISGPNPKEIEKYVYKVKDDCYKYTPYVTPCDSEKVPTRHVSDEGSYT
jgi:hypothetical protein